MSKLFEQLVETAQNAKDETCGKIKFCTLQVFADGTAYADGGGSPPIVTGNGESELVARLAARLANNRSGVVTGTDADEESGWQVGERFGWAD